MVDAAVCSIPQAAVPKQHGAFLTASNSPKWPAQTTPYSISDRQMVPDERTRYSTTTKPMAKNFRLFKKKKKKPPISSSHVHGSK
jgi:hypothetical protein